MTLEVYENGLVVGYVKATGTLEAYSVVREYFPNATSVNPDHLPTYDERCVKVNDNVYTWNLCK